MILTAAFIISKALGVSWSWWWLIVTTLVDYDHASDRNLYIFRK